MNPIQKRKKPNLSIQYVVRTKDDVDNLEARFIWFLQRCEIFDLTTPEQRTYLRDQVEDIPVVLARDADANLLINLDPCSMVSITDMTDVKNVTYGIGELSIHFKNDTVIRVKINVMGTET